jgi:hypothetical protein
MNAPQVRVNFHVKDFTIGSVPESWLGMMAKDIAAGATEEFETPWVPPSEGHFCVVVRIPLYLTPAVPPGIPVVEMTELNNIAQTNYDRFISTSSIPSREVTYVSVGNPYLVPTRVFLWPGQSNPLYRTYLEHTWLWLKPGETRKVMMMFEYSPDNLTNKIYPPKLVQNYREMQRLPNDVMTTSLIEDPNDNPRHKVDVLGGAQVQVVTGKSTEFQRFGVDGGRVYGKVVTVSDNNPVPGQVIMRLHKGVGNDISYVYKTVKLIQGAFSGTIEDRGHTIDAYYLPLDGYGDCWSKKIKIK